MTALNWLIVLLCIAAPVLFLVLRHEANKSARRDQQRFMADKQPDEDKKRPGAFLEMRNAQRKAAWQRRYIAAHPQTILRQRFPTLELLVLIDLRARRNVPLQFSEPVKADVGGHQGGGFACQADAITAAKLPDFLENIAAEIRADLPGLNRPSH